MVDSMNDLLRRDMECEALLECFHGLKEIDKEVFTVLHESESALSVDELAEKIDRERSTSYRSVQRLVQAGFSQKEQINSEEGSYYHVYRPRDADDIAQELQRTLNDWYAKIGQLIDEFNEKYTNDPNPTTPTES